MSDTGLAGHADEEPDTFTRVFGVSEAELRENGIDVGVYVAKHASKAVRNEKRMAFIWAKAPKSEQARHEALLWAGRAYKLMFGTFAVLLVSTIPALHAAKGILLGACVLGVCAVFVCLFRYCALLFRSRRLRRSGL